AETVQQLSRRIGFRVAPGFSERVIFRELFLEGLTVMDLFDDPNESVNISMSHVAAREEVRALLKTLEIPKLNEVLVRKKAASDAEAQAGTPPSAPQSPISQPAIPQPV